MRPTTSQSARPAASAVAAALAVLILSHPAAPAAVADGPQVPGSTDEPTTVAESGAELAAAAARPWTFTRRVISQGRGVGPAPNQLWRVDYHLRNDGPVAQVVPPGFVAAEVDGWVSNSRVADHATPRRSSLVLGGATGPCASAEVHGSRDEARRCRERGTLVAWAASDGDAPHDPLVQAVAAAGSPFGLVPAVVPPGGSLRVRVTLEHDHFLYGPYEPLLGPRSMVLKLGPAVLRDTLPMDQELNPSRTPPAWPLHEPAADRLDSRVFLTSPHSLHLEAHVPGNATYTFRGPVRYATRVKLSYWYLVAPGTEGDCKEQVMQLKQGQPSIYRTLHDGDQEHYLTTVGRWVHVQRVFRTEPEATNLNVEFRLTGDIGEMWVDDVTLEPLASGPVGP